MRKSHVVFLALLALSVSPRPAAAADRLACQTAGIITKCPADAQLAAGSVLQSAFVPWSAAPAGSIPNSALVTTPPTLSSSTPSAIGTAAAGLGTTASRFDHVHALPAVGTAGTYVYPISITTDAQGRATGITAGSAPQAASADLTALSGFGSGLGIPVRTSATPTWSISTTLSGVTINCSSNTCSNVSLTAAVTGVLPVVNGGTNSSTALGGNRAMVSSGGKIVETASTCPPGTVLGGGSPPDCTAAATIGTSLATPRVDATAGSGTLILNALTGNPVQLSVNSTTVLQAASGSITASQPLAMSSQKITGLATATTSGDALSWPWVTATNGSASLSSSPYNIASGSFTSIGLALSLPSAGTYYLSADLRTLINASLGTGGFIECQLYNTTDAAAIANTERIGAYEPVVNQQYYGQISINEIITIAAAKTIDVQCLRSGATTYTTSGVYSDANGRSRFSYIKVSP